MSASERSGSQRPMPRLPRAGSDDPVRRGALLGLAAVAGTGLVAAIVVLVLGEPAWLLSVGLGALVAAVVPLSTLLVLRLTAERSPQLLAGMVMGAYLVKLVVVAVMLFAFAAIESVERTVLGLTALAGIVAAVGFEAVGVVRTRQLYVDVPPPVVADDPRTDLPE